MKIKKGDKVIMLQGKDRDKTGKILRILKARDSHGHNRVYVEGLNMIKKHQRARKQGQVGQIVSRERSVSLSSVELVCPKCGQPTRVGHRVDGNPAGGVGGNKYRICKKCGADFS